VALKCDQPCMIVGCGDLVRTVEHRAAWLDEEAFYTTTMATTPDFGELTSLFVVGLGEGRRSGEVVGASEGCGRCWSCCGRVGYTELPTGLPVDPGRCVDCLWLTNVRS